MKTMYPAQVNSPGTELAAAIDAVQDTILVADGSVLPDGPNLLTIGTDEAAETILYTGKTGDELTGVTRAFQGTAQSWAAGTKVARYFTAYDHDAVIDNVSELTALGDATRDRLDIEQRQDIVLNAGMQILNAQRRAAFSLSGIKGRTLVNLAGRQANRYANNPAVTTLNVANHSIGNNTDTVNVDIKDTAEGYAIFNLPGSHPYTLVPDKCYLISMNIKINSVSGPGKIKAGGTYYGAVDADKTKIGVWQKLYFRFKGLSAEPFTNLIVGTAYADGVFAAANLDVKDVSLYELSQSDYDVFPSISAAQKDIKYPYVDSVQPVRNPYAIRYGENLLTPFYEWREQTGGSAYMQIISPYEVSITSPDTIARFLQYNVPALPQESYSLRAEATQNGVQWDYIDANGNKIGQRNKLVGESTTFITPIDTAYIWVYVYNDMTVGTFTFKNPMLTNGSEAKPFKPREDSMLALQTDLFADPLTGANADEVFEKDGQYFKLARWRKQALDALLDWRLNPQPRIGYKEVYVPGLVAAAIKGGGYASKFDGKILTALKVGATTTAGDQFLINSDNAFVLAISNTDTGWGDNYSPTADEIKAYFMGWKMWQGDSNDSNIPYTSGTKRWRSLTSGDEPSVLPTTQAPNWTPYQLVYQLATPTVEPIVSEGMLTFNEGDNQIEVGTGIVVRESANFVWNGNSSYTYNSNVAGAQKAKYRVKDFLHVYENSRCKYGTTKTVRTASNGTTLDIPDAIYDKTAAYSVIYLMLDTSPIVPFTGSYAANEKAMLQELTDVVQQNTTAVSVLMNKKAEKDHPGWITPTLLNGWLNFGNGTSNVAYIKDSLGFIHIKGRVKLGSLGWTPVFTLPPGHRPKEVLGFLGRGYTTQPVPCSIAVDSMGRVYVLDGTNTEAALDGVMFLAEQ